MSSLGFPSAQFETPSYNFDGCLCNLADEIEWIRRITTKQNVSSFIIQI